MADGVSLGRLVFEDLPGGRCRLIATSLIDGFESRDAFVASAMEVGVQEDYRKLDALLAPMMAAAATASPRSAPWQN